MNNNDHCKYVYALFYKAANNKIYIYMLINVFLLALILFIYVHFEAFIYTEKKCFTEYRNRVRRVLRSKLSSKNKITKSTPSLSQSFDTQLR